MTDTTKISIITVVFNGEKTIEDAINSVLSQKSVNLEYIVVDGKSTDNTTTLINKYSKNISYLISEPDGGIYDAMNKGLKIATGDIVGFLNADDLYNGYGILEQVISLFRENPNVDILYGDLVYVDKTDTQLVARYWRGKGFYNEFFADGLVPPHPSFFVRKHVYNNAGTFNTKFKLAADYEIMFRFLHIHKFSSIYLPMVLVRMRLGGATNRSIRNMIKGNLEISKAWKLYNQKTPPSFWLKRFLLKLMQFNAKKTMWSKLLYIRK